LLLLGACGGGGGGGGDDPAAVPPNNPPPVNQEFFAQGIYSGTTTDSSGQSNEMLAVIAADGTLEAITLDKGSVIYGALTPVGSNEASGDVRGLTAPGNYWPENGQNVIDVQVSLSQSATDGVIRGEFEYQAVTQASFTLNNYRADYDNPPRSFEEVAGTYSAHINGVDVSLAIDAAGVVSGYNAGGCMLSGYLQQIEPGKNLYSLSLTLTSCGSGDGNYSGKAFFILTQGQQPKLAVIGYDSKNAVGGLFVRQSRDVPQPNPVPEPDPEYRHPIQISGYGDVTSASGARNCSLEEYKAGAESCTRNLVKGDYSETYYAVARSGWRFDGWSNFCEDEGAGECRVSLSEGELEQYRGGMIPSLVASFSRLPHDGDLVLVDGGNHIIDYDITGRLYVDGSTTVTLVDGEVGEVSINSGSNFIVSGGKIGNATIWSGQATISGGRVDAIYSEGNAKIAISGGTVGGIQDSISGQYEITGGTFLGSIRIGYAGHVAMDIKGGKFQGDFHYNYGGQTNYTFYGNFALTDPVHVVDNQYESQISGTLSDGNGLSQKITCYRQYNVPETEPCLGVEIIVNR
jgi:hypothetical protein